MPCEHIKLWIQSLAHLNSKRAERKALDQINKENFCLNISLCIQQWMFFHTTNVNHSVSFAMANVCHDIEHFSFLSFLRLIRKRLSNSHIAPLPTWCYLCFITSTIYIFQFMIHLRRASQNAQFSRHTSGFSFDSRTSANSSLHAYTLISSRAITHDVHVLKS